MKSCKILAEWLYGVNPNDPEAIQNMTSEQKNIISNIISLGSVAIGTTTGNTTDIISSSVAGSNAVEDNYLTFGQKNAMKKEIEACGKNWKCRNDAYDRWHNLDKNINIIEKIGSDIWTSIISGAKAFHTIMTMDSQNVKGGLVGQGLFEFITLKMGASSGSAIGYEMRFPPEFTTYLDFSHIQILLL